ncbi:MAG: hypothetical protein AAF065_03985 [Verrucomicrobiota bacterium]
MFLFAVSVPQVLFCLFLLCFASSTARADTLLDHLSRYEGVWIGQFTIHSTATGYTESFPVQQRYWWEGDQLHGLAVSQRDSGMENATSITYMKAGKLISEVTRGEMKDSYIGVLNKDGLLWLPSKMSRATDYQIFESFVPVEGGPDKLMTEGFDTYVYSGGLAHIVYKGELIREPEVKGEKAR